MHGIRARTIMTQSMCVGEKRRLVMSRRRAGSGKTRGKQTRFPQTITIIYQFRECNRSITGIFRAISPARHCCQRIPSKESMPFHAIARALPNSALAEQNSSRIRSIFFSPIEPLKWRYEKSAASSRNLTSTNVLRFLLAIRSLERFAFTCGRMKWAHSE